MGGWYEYVILLFKINDYRGYVDYIDGVTIIGEELIVSLMEIWRGFVVVELEERKS